MKTLNSHFDKIYCINLDRRTDRWEECLNEFKKHNLNVERFSAIDGNKIENVNRYLVGSFEKSGQIGCLLSQLNVIKEAKNKNLSSVLIMEDDVQFCDNFNVELELGMSEIPDNWDIISFGSNHISLPIKVTNRIYKLTHAYSAHCYAIKNTLYDILIENLSQIKEPLDVTYANLYPYINGYVFNPHLVWQTPGYSDICEMYVDYTHVHKIGF